jgi:hypothetical protein
MTNDLVCFDIEATDLKASFGHVLCVSAVPIHSDEVITFRLDEYPHESLSDDKQMLLDVRDYLENQWGWVSWNGKLYDIPFLNARLLKHGIDPIERRLHVDLMYYARGQSMRIHSSRLDAVAKFFNFAEQKTDMNPDKWTQAFELRKDAMDYVVEHCEADVEVLKAAFDTLKQFVRNVHY